ncbi:MAG: NHLP leader peptide family RiPP precursor [Pseudanabaenaceae cyanobacterium SKYGB_i_bin29]|nr:NHLP leader peptide family RiPP precursor [Pseudanabaenaceae cyanobacterium SKYG29]MDW8421848.1 NHLP leader peptide family RiPP precursor [Pseudanabaenaceae cyanobacterium SKYGB_i_bin29]
MTKQIQSMAELFDLVQADANFKQQFIANPKAALAEVGMTVADNVEVNVLEETDKNVYFVIPPAEAAGTLNTEDDVIAQLIARAATDAALRSEMLADPKAVIARETGLVIPEEANVTVFEQTADKAYFVIPRATVQDGERELSAEELETVAGGGFWDFVKRVVRFSVNNCKQLWDIGKTVIGIFKGF